VCIFRELQCLTPRGRYIHLHTKIFTSQFFRFAFKIIKEIHKLGKQSREC